MKTILTLIIAGASIAVVHSQAPAPAPAPVAVAPQAPLQELQAIRDANVKLLEQQTKTLEQVTKMEEVAKQLKILGKRS